MSDGNGNATHATGPNFADDYHALVVGELVGAVLAQAMEAKPMADQDGNYVPAFLVRAHGRVYVVSVEPDPAERWDAS